MAEKDLLFYNTDTNQYEAIYARGNDLLQLAQTVSDLTQSTEEKLAEIINLKELPLAANAFKGKNAQTSLNLGANRPIHGVAVYVKGGFGGYEYWLAATPYSGYNEGIENPWIYASDDGENWFVPPGVSNPLSPAPTGSDIGAWHNSDTYLIYREDINRMEIWWRKRYRTPVEKEDIMRRTTTDGVNWTAEEVIFSINGISGDALSPSGNYDKKLGVYHCFTIKSYSNPTFNPTYLQYYKTDGDAKNWALVGRTELVFEDGREKEGWRIWHGDVKQIEGGFEAILTAGNESTAVNMHLFHTRSADGVKWSPLVEVLRNESPVDAKNIYHASILKTEEEQIIYYSGITADDLWTLNKTSIGTEALSSITTENTGDSTLAKIKTLNLEKQIELIGGYGEFIEFSSLDKTENKSWSATVGTQVTLIDTNNRLAMSRIELDPNTEYTLTNFSYLNDLAFYLADENEICLFSSNRLALAQYGWQKSGYTFTTTNNTKYLYVTALRRVNALEEKLTEADFGFFNQNALITKTPKENISYKLQNENNKLLENLNYVNSKKLVGDLIEGVWVKNANNTTHNALGGFNNYLSCREISVLENNTYVLENFADALVSYLLLDKDGYVIVDGGMLGSTGIISVPQGANSLLLNFRKRAGGNFPLSEAVTVMPDLSISLYKNSREVFDLLTPTLINNFTSTDAAFYKRADGIVHLEGTFSRTESPADGTIIFTLPSGYRPVKNSFFQTPTASIFVLIDGTVKVYSYASIPNLSAVSLYGVSFRTV